MRRLASAPSPMGAVYTAHLVQEWVTVASSCRRSQPVRKVWILRPSQGERMSIAARSVATREIPKPLAEKLTAAASSFGDAFEEARMHDIAEASGIPRATLYYYFPG